ncbi:MAG: TetR family transcriptional regulator [Stellaceae bacterium]
MPRSAGAKEKVERAATALFAARGVDGASIAEIATAAGVSQGALYRHYPSKEALAAGLFDAAYRRTTAGLAALRASRAGLAARIAAMVAHFCALYDRDPALFRFMLIAQHDILPMIAEGNPSPAWVVEATIADAVAAGELAPIEPAAGAAVVMGVVLQTATFHLYGRLSGKLSPRAPSLAAAALAGVRALAEAA